MFLDHILNAGSVAVVGASKVETKRGFQTIRTLLEDGYTGRIYPVNPKETEILGLKCYRKISDIDATVDLALVATPARLVPAVLEDCGKKGVHGAWLPDSVKPEVKAKTWKIAWCPLRARTVSV